MELVQEQPRLGLPQPGAQPSLTVPMLGGFENTSIHIQQGRAPFPSMHSMAAMGNMPPSLPFSRAAGHANIFQPQPPRAPDLPSVPITAPVKPQAPAPAPFTFGLAATPASTKGAQPTITAPVKPQTSAPAPFTFGLATSTQAAQPTMTAPVAAPQPSSFPTSTSATSKGMGTVSTSPAVAEPTCEVSFVMMPGETLRSCCEEWIEACAAFMGTSSLFSTLSQRWTRAWKQRALIALGEDLGPQVDDVAYDEDDATTFVKTFFKFQLLRRLDGPDDAGKNSVLEYLRHLAAKEGIDLGPITI